MSLGCPETGSSAACIRRRTVTTNFISPIVKIGVYRAVRSGNPEPVTGWGFSKNREENDGFSDEKIDCNRFRDGRIGA